VVLSINLVLTDEEDNIFYNEYNRDYSEIQKVQREVAKKIANEISIEISPDAMERIDAIPTDSPEAYDHYLRGNEIYFKANNVSQKNEEWTKQLDRATLEYNKAIETDPSFAQAYVGLALVDYKRNVHADILK
jgi:adenylate cyclase